MSSVLKLIKPAGDLRVEAAKLEQILNGLKSVSSNLESTLWGIGGARSARSGGMPEKARWPDAWCPLIKKINIEMEWKAST